MFNTAYNTCTRDSLCTPSGEKIITEHREEMDINGRRKLIKDRKINIYERIQSSKDSTDINNILRRAAEGDYNVLNMVSGNYLDIVDAPSSLAEAQHFVIRAKEEFNSLPKEVKAKFENNAEIYVAQYGTKLWQDSIGYTEAKEIEKAKMEAEKKYKELQEKAFKTIVETGGLRNE